MKLLCTATLLLTLSLLPLHAADQEKLQLAREVIQLTQRGQMLDSINSSIQQLAAAQIAGQNVSPEQKAQLEAIQKETMVAVMEATKTMLGKMDEIYADVYTLEELKGIKAFFSSKEGSAMIQKQPELMKRMMPLMMELQKTAVAKAQESAAKLMKPAAVKE